MKIDEIESRRSEVQAVIDGRKSIESRRKMGQFSTPGRLANQIVSETLSYFAKSDGRLRVLEPSMGTGAFVSAVLKAFSARVKDIRGYELDEDFFRAAVDLWKGLNVDARRGDFTQMEPERVFDLVVANPPYVRHHALTSEEKKRLQGLVKKCTGIEISGLAGLYCHFLLLSQSWMARNGIGVWLIPSEWMSVNYGGAIRKFLASNVTLLRVHRFDADDVRFSDALVSSCVVWFKNTPSSATTEAAFTFGSNLKEPTRIERIKSSSLRESGKWPPIGKGDDQHGKWRIGDFFDIRRGVVTGDNSFFVMSEVTAKEKGIPKRYLRPILPSPRNLPVNHVTADEDGMPSNVERRYLLDCSGHAISELPPKVRGYLESGLKTTALKKLCASRDVWYEQEKRDVTPFLCSYMGRGAEDSAPVRFVLNDTRAIVSNSFLMMYPKHDLARVLQSNPSLAETVWSFLIRIPREAIVSAGRSYGGGLQKVEPRELASVTCDELHAWMMTHVDDVTVRYHTDDKGNMLLFERPKRRKSGTDRKGASAMRSKRKSVKYPRHG